MTDSTKRLLATRYGYRIEKPIREAKSPEQRQLQAVINSAIAYFEHKRGDMVELPADSSERATVEMALGVLQQASASIATSADHMVIRGAIQMVRVNLQQAVEAYDPESDVYIVVYRIIDELSDLAGTLSGSEDEGMNKGMNKDADEGMNKDADEDADGDGDGDEDEDEDGDEGADKDADEDEDATSDNALATALGLIS